MGFDMGLASDAIRLHASDKLLESIRDLVAESPGSAAMVTNTDWPSPEVEWFDHDFAMLGCKCVHLPNEQAINVGGAHVGSIHPPKTTPR